MTLIAETLSESEILPEPKKQTELKIISKSKSAIFSRQRDTRFKTGIFPGQVKDIQMLDSPAPNQYNQTNRLQQEKFQLRKSANFLSSTRPGNVFAQLKERDTKIDLAPGQYERSQSMEKAQYGIKT
jgi:hypothetical protein